MNFLDKYNKDHQNRINRILHTVGIPTVVISILLFFWNWRLGLAVFILGWILQFAGHIFEGKKPSFFSNPIYLLIGPFWWLKKLIKK